MTTDRGTGITLPTEKKLPAWPIFTLIYGFPLFWALGALPFVYMALAGVMIALMVAKGSLVLIPGVAPYAAFLLWAGVAVVNVQTPGQAIGFLWRLGDLLAIGTIIFYYSNARETLSISSIVRGLTYMWACIVVLGMLATMFPEVRLVTPVGLIMPGVLTNNDLVYELVFPRMAEVQEPWGAIEPYNRPAAPFPYTNSWGMAYALLTPLVASVAVKLENSLARTLILLLLVASLWPAIATSNRGMFLGLGITVTYLMFRLLMAGRILPFLVTLSVALVGASGLILSGVVADILGRQAHSDSTGTRSSVYRETLETTLESPLLGWANPRQVPGVEVALGTQGYAWTLMFCFGFVGLGLFVLFLVGAIVRSWRVTSLEFLALHGVLVTALLMMVFYGLGTTQLFIVMLIAAALLRELSSAQGAPHAEY